MSHVSVSSNISALWSSSTGYDPYSDINSSQWEIQQQMDEITSEQRKIKRDQEEWRRERDEWRKNFYDKLK